MVRNPRGGVQWAKSITLDRPLSVKLACQGCRSSHQKCDGALPICLRCKKVQKLCDYAPSRRGRAVAHLHKKSMKPLSSVGDEYGTPMPQEELPISLTKAFEDAPSWNLQMPFAEASPSRLDDNEDLTAAFVTAQVQPSLRPKPYYVSAFYSSFWPAHPFLPPIRHLQEHLSNDGGMELFFAIDLIGSKYSDLQSGRTAFLYNQKDLHEYPPNGLSVQALILLAILHHMTNDKEKAQMALQIAVKIALDIGLDKTSFAAKNGRGVPSIEESWRRTWWELFILDVMFAALNQKSDFRLKNLSLEVRLPCTEAIYRAGDTLPEPQSLAAFDARFFMDDEIEYSSFSYHIAAARALTKIIIVSCAQETPPLSSIRDAELEMEVLKLHLPSKIRTYVDSEGEVDEVAFQAHMIMNAGTIYLHRPRSLLASPNPDYTIACAPNNTSAHSHPVQHHTRKTVEAANEICYMISSSSAVLKHTPFFICAVAMQAIVHLGMYRLPQLSSQQTVAEQQIKMSIGALRELSQVWWMAEIVRQDVKNVARAILDTAQSSRSSNVETPAVRPTMPQAAREQNRIEDLPPFNFDSMSQVHDDSWIDEFLGVDTVT